MHQLYEYVLISKLHVTISYKHYNKILQYYSVEYFFRRKISTDLKIRGIHFVLKNHLEP